MRKLLFLAVIIPLCCHAIPKSAEQQALHLQAILHQADAAYHNKNTSLMSNAAYDALREQFEQLIEKYPELKTSPATIAPPPGTGTKAAHTLPVLSLEKAYSHDTVESFIEKCGTNLLYCIEPKIDGLTVILRYKNGQLIQAITRGDGITGSDVTTAVLASGAAPIKLINTPDQLEVRGEVYLTYSAFKALNLRREKAGQAPLKSPRNTAAGTLRLKDYAEVANRNISIRLFELIDADAMPATHTQALELMRSSGLPVIESQTVTTKQLELAIENLNQRRVNFPFQTDGIVIRVDALATFHQLGATAHHPRGALARKYKETPVLTHLLNVTWSVGESGKQTPIAHFEPIEIHGATLTKASLHNLNHIRAMDLKLGDWIQVIRAGGSIPEIIGVCPDRRTGRETTISEPKASDI